MCIRDSCNAGSGKNNKGNITVCLSAQIRQQKQNHKGHKYHSSNSQFIRCIHQPILLSNHIPELLSLGPLQKDVYKRQAYLPVRKQSGSVQSSEMYSQKFRTRLSPSGSSLCASLKLLVLFQAVSYTSKSIQSTFLFVKRD